LSSPGPHLYIASDRKLPSRLTLVDKVQDVADRPEAVAIRTKN